MTAALNFTDSVFPIAREHILTFSAVLVSQTRRREIRREWRFGSSAIRDSPRKQPLFAHPPLPC